MPACPKNQLRLSPLVPLNHDAYVCVTPPPPLPITPPGGGGTVTWPVNNKKSIGNHRRRREILVGYTGIQVSVVWCPSPPPGGGGEPSFGDSPPGWGTVVPGGGGVDMGWGVRVFSLVPVCRGKQAMLTPLVQTGAGSKP